MHTETMRAHGYTFSLRTYDMISRGTHITGFSYQLKDMGGSQATPPGYLLHTGGMRGRLGRRWGGGRRAARRAAVRVPLQRLHLSPHLDLRVVEAGDGIVELIVKLHKSLAQLFHPSHWLLLAVVSFRMLNIAHENGAAGLRRSEAACRGSLLLTSCGPWFL